MADVNLEMIQTMLQRVIDTQREHGEVLGEHTRRFSHLETMVAGQRREAASDAEQLVHLELRFDRLRDDIDKIKRRLDLGDA